MNIVSIPLLDETWVNVRDEITEETLMHMEHIQSIPGRFGGTKTGFLTDIVTDKIGRLLNTYILANQLLYLHTVSIVDDDNEKKGIISSCFREVFLLEASLHDTDNVGYVIN